MREELKKEVVEFLNSTTEKTVFNSIWYYGR